VEAFNQILIEEKQPYGFMRGFKKFHTKEDLDPFAISKFLGHNAIHALLGYLAKEQGIAYMHEAGKQKDLMEMVRSAFIDESGAGLCKEFSQVGDPLFSDEGFCDYVDDALTRMVNPYLRDPVDRVTRDPVRKLGWEDRLIGSMKLARRAGVEPKILAKGAALALQCACVENSWGSPKIGLDEIWRDISETEQNDIRGLILGSC
jgi:mannitol-1-phosphate 5-dehydrogenase